MKHHGLLFTLLLTLLPLGVAARDLHRLWDDRCFECHGHAGEFARRSLSIANGRLQGRHHVDDLRAFMDRHYLQADDADAVYEMLFLQAGHQARFKTECSGCHGNAASFTRRSLELRDGDLYGVKSGQPISRFLQQHRGLNLPDAEFFSVELRRVAREVYRQ